MRVKTEAVAKAFELLFVILCAVKMIYYIKGSMRNATDNYSDTGFPGNSVPGLDI